jgi:hypothetical protein
MDCVAADGTAVIAYWARLTWGLVRVVYASTLVRQGGQLTEIATLHGGPEPICDSHGITWHCDRLRASGHWNALTGPVSRTLLESNEGSILWHCLVPRASGRVVLTRYGVVEGLGYVERLDMTLRPWKLPIQELRWGRIVTGNSGAVWIAWQGPRPLTLALVNGCDVATPEIGESGLTWQGGRLDLEAGSLLREGPLGTSVLGHIPLVARVTPRRLYDTFERKDLRRGTLHGVDGRVESGWAIDEIVRFAGEGT